jgi:hypothetical protein
MEQSRSSEFDRAELMGGRPENEKPRGKGTIMNSKENLEVVATEEEVKVETAPIELSATDLDWIGGGAFGGISY